MTRPGEKEPDEGRTYRGSSVGKLATELILPHLIQARATSSVGDEPFLGDVTGASRSYAAIDLSSRRWAAGLLGLGVVAGDRVGVMLPTSIAAFELWVAVGWLRALEVPVHGDYRGSMLRHVLDNSGVKVLVIAERFLERLWPIVSTLGSLEIVVVVPESPEDVGDVWSSPPEDWRRRIRLAASVSSAEPASFEGPEGWDVGSIVYTSGTTGPAKGVMVAWRQFYKHAEIFFPAEDLDGRDAFYCPLPLSHIAARVGIYCMALAGGRAVLRERFSIESFWSDIRDHRCTSALMMGSIAEMLWRRTPQETDAATPLRNVLMAPLIPAVDAFKTRFNLRVRTQFGMTETTAPLGSGIVDDWDLANTESCGRVLRGFECRIVDDHDEPVGPDVVGELLVRTNDPWLVMLGYWNDANATAAAFRNQWYHTGDAFRYDADGNYYFVDRLKDTIRRRGENISSFDVEHAIASHEDVADCAVVGVQSSLTEQEIHAFVVPMSPGVVTGKDIAESLVDHLPAFMIPRYWTFLAELPRTPTQRVRKVELRERGIAADGTTWDRTEALRP